MDSSKFKEMLEPFDRLIDVKVFERTIQLPERNSILRGFQFLNSEEISYGDFCWNGECINCQVWIRNGDKEKMVMACRTDVTEGMEITKLGDTFDSIFD